MRTLIMRGFVGVLLIVATRPAVALQVNVDFERGDPDPVNFGTPSATYAAAAPTAGVWNSVSVLHANETLPLVDETGVGPALIEPTSDVFSGFALRETHAVHRVTIASDEDVTVTAMNKRRRLRRLDDQRHSGRIRRADAVGDRELGKPQASLRVSEPGGGLRSSVPPPETSVR